MNILRTADILATEDTRHTGRLLQLLGISRSGRMLSHHQHNTRTRVPELIDAAKPCPAHTSRHHLGETAPAIHLRPPTPPHQHHQHAGTPKTMTPHPAHVRTLSLAPTVTPQAGESVAVVSDAGTPGISDPGVELAAACADAGVRVVPVPGACAAVAAVSVSGLAPAEWVFVGFLPARRGAARARALAALAAEPRAAVLYEAPHRLLDTLRELADAAGGGGGGGAGDRDAVLARPALFARELTKQHEELYRGTVGSALEHFGGGGGAAAAGAATAARGAVRGEFTIVLAARVERAVGAAEAQEAMAARLLELRRGGMTASSAVKLVARDLGARKSVVYALATQLWAQPAEGGSGGGAAAADGDADDERPPL
ncbi:tetrapyrrole methylase [Tribonema minus]|uniref:Tetrapyrrole methylase n=1 Tax=Tribonema minus TaxID=303371 RepID=A0A835ZCH8_9STRA|nr:tetrapyrrole methylase [Tribonema minus]